MTGLRSDIFIMTIVILAASMVLCTAFAEERSTCLMTPEHVSVPIPEEGLTKATLPGNGAVEPCESIPTGFWTIKPSNRAFLFVNAAGPSGSGRYWKITVGIGSEDQTKPDRGICLSTTTIGWRTLQSHTSPLVWNTDLDDDGHAELVVWDSFSLQKEAQPGNFALIAWVYKLDHKACLRLDWAESRKLALSIAQSYRTDLNQGEPLKQIRRMAAQALEAFGNNMCAVDQ